MMLLVHTYTWVDVSVFLLVLEGSTDSDAAKDVAMHVAALNPKYISRDQVSAEEVEHERKILLNKH